MLIPKILLGITVASVVGIPGAWAIKKIIVDKNKNDDSKKEEANAKADSETSQSPQGETNSPVSTG